MYCKHCGVEISDNASFCSKCGKKVNSNLSFIKNKIAESKNNSNRKLPVFLLVAIGILVLILTFCPLMEVKAVATMYNLGGRDLGYTTMLVNSVDSFYADEFSGIMANTRITYIFTVLVSFAILFYSYLDKYVYSFLLSLAYIPIIVVCVLVFISQMNEVTRYLNVIMDFDIAMVFMFPVVLCIWATIVYCFASMLFVKKHKNV